MNVEEWDRHWSDNRDRYGRNKELRRRLPVMRQFIRGRTADIGCGVVDLYKPEDDITGVDISPECVREMQRRCPTGTWQVGDAARTGLPDSSFDTVICSHVLEHFYDQRPIVEELKRIVRPDGNVVIIVPRRSVGADHVHPKWWPAKIEDRISRHLRDGRYELFARNQWLIQGGKTATAAVVMIAWSPNGKRLKLMRRCLESLRAGTKYAHRLIVVDNGPAAQTELVKFFAPDVHILNRENQGPAASRNMGAGAADSDYLAFVDNDVLFYEDWLAESVALLERYRDRKLIAVPTECPVMRRRENALGELDGYKLAKFGGSACWVMRRRTFEEVGRWTQTVPQDADYAARARELGYAFIYRPEGPCVRHLAWHDRTFQAEERFVGGTWVVDPHDKRGMERFKRALLADYARRFGCTAFVETGTYKGDTVKAMILAGRFERIWSVDISPGRAAAAQKRFRSFAFVHCEQGDSAAWLPTVLARIDRPTLFWLDAHGSQEQVEKTGLATPIAVELKAILDHPLAARHVILVDDSRYYKQDYPGYPTMEHLQALVRAKLPGHVCEDTDDILRIHAGEQPC